MGRIVEPEKYDPEKHWKIGKHIMIDKASAKIVLPVLGVFIAIVVVLNLAGVIR